MEDLEKRAHVGCSLYDPFHSILGRVQSSEFRERRRGPRNIHPGVDIWIPHIIQHLFTSYRDKVRMRKDMLFELCVFPVKDGAKVR